MTVRADPQPIPEHNASQGAVAPYEPTADEIIEACGGD